MNTQIHNTIVRGGLRRPNWICKNVKQIVILVRDASGSMSGTPAAQASTATLDLVGELANPSNKDGFIIAIVDFAENAVTVHDLTRASDLNGKVTPLQIGRSMLGGTTNLTAGIETANGILGKARRPDQAGTAYLRPVVIAFTDGGHNQGPAPHDAANRLKAIADLVTVAFGDSADEALMRDLACTPQHFYRCSNGRELRQFLAAMGATMTATMAAGANATQALATIRQ